MVFCGIVDAFPPQMIKLEQLKLKIGHLRRANCSSKLHSSPATKKLKSTLSNLQYTVLEIIQYVYPLIQVVNYKHML